MNATTGKDVVVAQLLELEYAILPAPLEIAGIEFDFDQVMIGPADTLDLVVIVSVGLRPTDRVLNEVRSASRALDLAGSRRSLTAILTDCSTASDFSELHEFCRVIVVERGDKDKVTANKLSVFRRLPNPQRVDLGNDDPLARLLESLGPNDARQLIGSDLIAAAAHGKSAVETAYLRFIETAAKGKTGDG